uniref:Nop domain-containing protein n=1 Tax=Leersia perrieri TaxID=77586 RepID=A0A0D9VKK7_9ORYZ
MASLPDSFLADLDELSDNEAYHEDAEARNMEEDGNGGMPCCEFLDYDDLSGVSKLHTTQRYKDIIQKIEDALHRGTSIPYQETFQKDVEHQLIADSNALLVDIDNEVTIIHNFIRDKYKKKLPLLESRVHHPIDYAPIVKKIGNEMDLTHVDLKDILPSADVMWIIMTDSITSKEPLSEENLVKTIEACDRALTLDAAKRKILEFLECQMGCIAPNLSAIVGSDVASKLMGATGGLEALANMPACNLQLLGTKKKNLSGFSTSTSQFRVGYLEQTEVFQSTIPSLRTHACRLIAAKSTLAARIDSIRGDPTGKTGHNLLEEIRKKVEKMQELPPARLPKLLPVPDSILKKKRGGSPTLENERKSDMMKLANRMRFGVPEDSSLGDGLGKGYGLLGQAGSGKLRRLAGQSRLGAKVAKRFKDRSYDRTEARSGLASILGFTPVQGMELSNPLVHNDLSVSGTRITYFSDNGTFSNIRGKDANIPFSVIKSPESRVVSP